MGWNIKYTAKGGAKLVKSRRRYRPQPLPVKLDPHRPELKAILEGIWADTKVRNPQHINWWNSKHGYAVYEEKGNVAAAIGLFVAKGRKTYGRKGPRIRAWLFGG